MPLRFSAGAQKVVLIAQEEAKKLEEIRLRERIARRTFRKDTFGLGRGSGQNKTGNRTVGRYRRQFGNAFRSAAYAEG